MTSRVALLMCCGVLVACEGTDTGNPPVIGFENSDCKDGASDKGISRQSSNLDASLNDPLYDGLVCFAWKRLEHDQLRVTVTNYRSGCGAEHGWSPKVELREDGGLDLVLQDDECSTAACGSCRYDLAFTFELPETVQRMSLPARIFERGCPGEHSALRALLPLGTSSEGSVCGYSTGHWIPSAETDRGEPCDLVPVSPDAHVRACAAGLQCVDLGQKSADGLSGGTRCLTPCESDAQCDRLTQCREGFCKLPSVGVTRE